MKLVSRVSLSFTTTMLAFIGALLFLIEPISCDEKPISASKEDGGATKYCTNSGGTVDAVAFKDTIYQTCTLLCKNGKFNGDPDAKDYTLASDIDVSCKTPSNEDGMCSPITFECSPNKPESCSKCVKK